MLGLATGLSLSVGLEMMIYLALLGGATVLLWVVDRDQRRRLAAYAAALARGGLPGEAAEQLGAALKRDWDVALVRAYGLVPAADPRRQLALAESLRDAHPREPELLLALGRIALRNRLWGKARDYLEASLKLAALPETCAELARLCEHLGETEQSRALLARAVRGEDPKEIAAWGQQELQNVYGA